MLKTAFNARYLDFAKEVPPHSQQRVSRSGNNRISVARQEMNLLLRTPAIWKERGLGGMAEIIVSLFGRPFLPLPLTAQTQLLV